MWEGFVAGAQAGTACGQSPFQPEVSLFQLVEIPLHGVSGKDWQVNEGGMVLFAR